MRIKRVLFIGGFYRPGSAPTNFVLTFVKGYQEMGLDVRLLMKIMPGEEVPQIQGVNCSYMVHDVSLKGHLDFFKGEKPLADFLKENYVENETVVQYYGSPRNGWIHKSKYPSFFTVGEVPFANPNVSLSFKLLEWAGRRATKNANGLLVQTNELKNYFENYGVKNIQVFNILIDPSRFNNLVEDEEDNYISYCGSIGLYKDGVHDLIEAFAITHNTHPQIKLRLIGAFFSPEDEIALRGMVEKLQLEGSVIFTGLVQPKDMPALLYNSKILALARPNNNQARYGFPSKLGEYLFTGRPVVVTRVGEIDHFLSDKESCVFAEPDNPVDFSEKLSWVLDNPEESRIIGYNGRSVAYSQFSMRSQCEVVIDYMETILNK